MPFPSFGFTEAKSYDERVYEEQVLLERWRKHVIATYTLFNPETRGWGDLTKDERLAVLTVNAVEKYALEHELACDGLDGRRTETLRNIKRKVF